MSGPVAKLSLPLTFQQELFHEIHDEDKLVIMARGLGLLRLVINLLHSYDVSGSNMVVLVGATPEEEEVIGEGLMEHAVLSGSRNTRGLSVINTDSMTISAREKLYARGGILTITSRILIVDMLRGGLPPENITGIVVLHGERITATSQEAFILRVYRERNKQGFLKAFSDNPVPLTAGYSPLATTLKNLCLRSSSLWPRFHISVGASLDTTKAEVIEISVAMTDSMKEIQHAILQCIEQTVSEIRKMNSRELDIEDWSVENALHVSFDVTIRRQLDPIWHRVGFKTKQLVGDLKTLRKLLRALVLYDCVSFFQYLEYIQAMQQPTPGSTLQTQSPWLFLDEAQTIFAAARGRVYSGKISGQISNGLSAGLVPVLEEQPKWEVLANILDEIEREIYFSPLPDDDSHSTILIMCEEDEDNLLYHQLRDYIQAYQHSRKLAEDGSSFNLGHPMLRRRLRRYFRWKQHLPSLRASFQEDLRTGRYVTELNHGHSSSRRGRPPQSKRRRTRGGNSAVASSNRVSDMQTLGDLDPTTMAAAMFALAVTDGDDHFGHGILVDQFTGLKDCFRMCDPQELVVVHPYKADRDDKILEELKPRYIIMYTPDPAFVRRVELYKCSHTNRQIKIYFLCYNNSVEEQVFLSQVRKEKDAFSKLIRERGNMTIALATDTLDSHNPEEQFLRTISSRIAGGGKLTKESEPPRVIVDAREFRSSSALPSLIHARQIQVVPCTLTVGDYILTPDICVERKTVPDLTDSMRSGRLYAQCESMVKYYKNPILLIEFNENKAFVLDPFSDLSSGPGHDLQSKLCLLTLAFPQVRIIWSMSPYQSAEILEELKKQQPEPDADVVVRYGLEDGEDALNTGNRIAQDILKCIPGITERNYRGVMTEAENVAGLSAMSQQELMGLVGSEGGKKTYHFLNKTV